MLMESGIKDSLDAAIAKKPRSLDLQSLYDQKFDLSVDNKKNQGCAVKRKKVGDDDSGEEKKKSKKEHLLSSLPSYKGGPSSVASGLNKSEFGPSRKSDEKVNGFDGTSLYIDGVIPQVPKRRRGLFQRKKADVSNRLKHEGILGGKVSSSDVAADLDDVSKGMVGQGGEVNGKSDQDGNSKGSYNIDVDKKGKQKQGFNEKTESRPTKLDLLQLLKTENGNSHAHSGDPSSNNKVKRNRKKREETGLKIDNAGKDAKPVFQKTTMTHGKPLGNDEDNLEENAARMLSSRFDPTCVGFSSDTRSSNAPSVVPSCGDDANHGSNVLESDISSDDNDVRILRPRDQGRKKGAIRKRRHFYEVMSKDVDAHWMVKRKIKVYWPLDQIWYFGEVLGYDPKEMLHHIKYDDREEEWIDLRNERVKLLGFPSELPLKDGRRRRGSGTKGKHDAKVTSNFKVQDGYPVSRQMDGEPIIPWWARLNGQMKSPSISSSKKQKTSEESDKVCPSLSITTECATFKTVDIRSSQNSADKLLSNPGLSDSSHGKEVARTSPLESNSRYPIVYFRRGVRKRASDSLAVLPKGSHPTGLCSVELPQIDDEIVIMKPGVPVMSTEICALKLNFVPFCAPYYSFAVENLLLFHTALMLQHGTLMCLWPRVHLELFSVDHFAGLRFLLFEGCLMQAIAFVFSILDVFHQSNQHKKHGDEQLPITSIWFQFSRLEDLTKQLVFALHNFCALETSRWVSLDRFLRKHCCIAKQLTPSECTYDNIKALKNGSNHLNLPWVTLETSSKSWLRRRTSNPVIGASSDNVNHSQSPVKGSRKWGRVPSFALSFSSAPTFVLNLQLKLLTECSTPDMRNNGASVGCEDAEIIPKVSQISQALDDDCLNTDIEVNSKQYDSLAQPLCIKDHCSEPEGKTTYYPLSGITVEIPLFDPQERPSSGGLENGKSSVIATDVTDGAIFSPIPPASSSSLNTRQVENSLQGNISGGNPDLLCNGPKKPRTHVSYSVPPEDHDGSLKDRGNLTKGFSSKRIRRASKKKELDSPKKDPRNAESLLCDVNVLIWKEDRGWREGASVVLELFDNSEWRLAVKISDCTRYSHKAHQFLQYGSTNRYTHAMMWKAGKDWTLEFPERSQWTLFKEMHQECYDRNLRAALVKNIPIPGVSLIEEKDDNGAEIPFVQSSSRYIRQLQNDVDIAMDPSHVLYDMDSDDESWVSNIRSFDVKKCETGYISDEIFEKIMDTLEKVAYANQQDHFTSEELEQLNVEGGPLEVIKVIYDHWLERRQERGMPLLRHLQPPLWEKYQQQVKEFESALFKSNGAVSTGCHGNAIEKPPMYAFCMKPRGLILRLPNNRGPKHRSHKKHPATRHVNAILEDPESFHNFGTGRRFNGYATAEEKIMTHHGYSDSSPSLQPSARLSSPRVVRSPGYYSPNNDGHESIHYPRLHRIKSKKIGDLISPNDRQVVSPHSQRFMSNRNGMQARNTHQSQWASPRYFHPDGPQRLSFKHLNPADLDEFKLRDASSAAQHAVIMAKLKRENAQRLLYKADLAIHKATVALMTADAIKASREDSTNDASSEG